MHKLSDIPIQRHVKVKDTRSPFDGDAVYWSMRTGKHPELRRNISGLIQTQKGLCSRCGMFFKPGDQMVKIRSFYPTQDQASYRWELVHEYCQDQRTWVVCVDSHHFAEEPDEGKPSRPVL